MSSLSVSGALGEFISHYQKSYPILKQRFDPDWRSPCEVGEPFAIPFQGSSGAEDSNHRSGQDSAFDSGQAPGSPVQQICWQPMKRDPDSVFADFTPIEQALEITVHADIKAYYGGYWSGGLEAEAPDGHASLIFVWNEEDIARLNENLIGHALAKRQSKSPFSVFFACTEPDSELFLSIENETGAILLEKPGYRPVRRVAECLTEFLETLVPAPPQDQP